MNGTSFAQSVIHDAKENYQKKMAVENPVGEKCVKRYKTE